MTGPNPSEEQHRQPKEAQLMESTLRNQEENFTGWFEVQKTVYPLENQIRETGEEVRGFTRPGLRGPWKADPGAVKTKAPLLPGLPDRDTQSPSRRPRSRYSRLHRLQPGRGACRPPYPPPCPPAALYPQGSVRPCARPPSAPAH